MSTAPTLAGAVNSLNRISDHHENFLSAHEELMGKFDKELEVGSVATFSWKINSSR